MRVLIASFRWILLFLVASLAVILLNVPWLALISVFSFKVLGIALASLVALTSLILLSLPEYGMLKLLHGQTPRTLGLRNSYELAQRMAAASGVKRPRLITYPDPVPNLFVVRSIQGSGMILLSEGFVALLEETEIRFALAQGIRHLRSPEIFVQSGCIFILTLLQKKIPFRPQSMKPGDALRSLVLFPWMRMFRKIAHASVTKRVDSNILAEEFVRGSSKISRAERLYGQQASLPGLVYLGLQR
jgi:hypothetical protein